MPPFSSGTEDVKLLTFQVEGTLQIRQRRPAPTLSAASPRPQKAFPAIQSQLLCTSVTGTAAAAAKGPGPRAAPASQYRKPQLLMGCFQLHPGEDLKTQLRLTTPWGCRPAAFSAHSETPFMKQTLFIEGYTH